MGESLAVGHRQRGFSMKLKIMKIVKKPSKFGGDFYYIYFKDTAEGGKSYKTCVSSTFRNFGHWRSIVERFKPDGDCDYFVNNARLKGSKGNTIDADNAPSLIITPKE